MKTSVRVSSHVGHAFVSILYSELTCVHEYLFKLTVYMLSVFSPHHIFSFNVLSYLKILFQVYTTAWIIFQNCYLARIQFALIVWIASLMFVVEKLVSFAARYVENWPIFRKVVSLLYHHRFWLIDCWIWCLGRDVTLYQHVLITATRFNLKTAVLLIFSIPHVNITYAFCSQILYTCETCDVIFCVLCQNGASHKPINEESKNCEHTVVPYAVAIKRMAEILIYKANECLSKVNLHLWAWP